MVGRARGEARSRRVTAPSERGLELYGVRFHRLASSEVLGRILRRDPDEAFAYIVTPNVDHVVRLHTSDTASKRCYEEAWLSLCDSAVLSVLARTAKARLPLVTGSDLVAAIFAHLDRSDQVAIVGCEADHVEALRRRYGLTNVAHYNPPLGFINLPKEVQACLDFVADRPARFIFFAVGSPQQEILANRLYHHGNAKGLGLCVGSSLRFLAGAERRAPSFLRGSGFEWLFRLAQDPRRLWRRYLLHDPMIFRIALSCAFASAFEARSGSAAKSRWPLRRRPDRR